jgi:hypothetical protein
MALQLVKENNLIVIKLIKKVHVIALFKKKLKIHGHNHNNGKNNDIDELITTLEYMSLIIIQITAYIS